MFKCWAHFSLTLNCNRLIVFKLYFVDVEWCGIALTWMLLFPELIQTERQYCKRLKTLQLVSIWRLHHLDFIKSLYEPRYDKTNKMSVHPVWSESSLCAQWVAKDQSFLHADSEDSDQTGRMPRLIRVFAGRTLTLLVLSCRGSYHTFFLYFELCLAWLI